MTVPALLTPPTRLPPQPAHCRLQKRPEHHVGERRQSPPGETDPSISKCGHTRGAPPPCAAVCRFLLSVSEAPAVDSNQTWSGSDQVLFISLGSPWAGNMRRRTAESELTRRNIQSCWSGKKPQLFHNKSVADRRKHLRSLIWNVFQSVAETNCVWPSVKRTDIHVQWGTFSWSLNSPLQLKSSQF